MSYYKHQPDSFSSAKWWLTAGCCGFLVTLSFVGAILWLGVNVRQTETFVTSSTSTNVQDRQRFQRKPIPHFRDLPEPEPEPVLPEIPQESPPVPSTPPPPSRTFRPFVSSRGRIEMVKPSEIAHEKQPDVPTRIRLPIPEHPRHKLPQNPQQNVEFTDHNQQNMEEFAVKHNPPQRNLEEFVVDQRKPGGKLDDPVPDYPSSLEDAFGSIPPASGGPSTKKKSEAVYPNWFGEDDNPGSRTVAERPENRVLQEDGDNYESSQSSDESLPEQVIPDFIYLKDVKNVRGEEEATTRVSRNPMLMFLRRRIQDLYDWMSAGGKVRSDDEWLDLLRTINRSISDGNFTSVVGHLKKMYNETTSGVGLDELPVDSLIYGGVNGSMNPVSFGLLAVDLFLLHNVQQIAWNEESGLGEKMMNDPDVVAMNALFLPTDRLQRLRSEGSRLLTQSASGTQQKQGFVDELLELLTGGLRAVLNLSRAYRSSVTARASNAASPLDCVWTLYCRNLEKTARLHGPYGFLAKINRLGLRLLMGEFPVENAVENLVKEATQGWQAIHCEKLFPRCGGEEAKDIVLETVMRGSSINQ
ncbi:uncharacterized protein LOC111043512 [Nilaparvata lugens]|uniref:uncharacterized protein LOC111043512 n=1 Tax=Nilaparvata lugens TaxID=108931 RepID=UPI00193C86B0|nr:uncharacterized protein LOC111043512 [Nilaparvata lugens]